MSTHGWRVCKKSSLNSETLYILVYWLETVFVTGTVAYLCQHSSSPEESQEELQLALKSKGQMADSMRQPKTSTNHPGWETIQSAVVSFSEGWWRSWTSHGLKCVPTSCLPPDPLNLCHLWCLYLELMAKIVNWTPLWARVILFFPFGIRTVEGWL